MSTTTITVRSPSDRPSDRPSTPLPSVLDVNNINANISSNPSPSPPIASTHSISPAATPAMHPVTDSTHLLTTTSDSDDQDVSTSNRTHPLLELTTQATSAGSAANTPVFHGYEAVQESLHQPHDGFTLPKAAQPDKQWALHDPSPIRQCKPPTQPPAGSSAALAILAHHTAMSHIKQTTLSVSPAGHVSMSMSSQQSNANSLILPDCHGEHCYGLTDLACSTCAVETAGTKSMTYEQMLLLARRFQPIVSLHEDEKYFPVSPQEYIEGCSLWFRVQKPNLTKEQEKSKDEKVKYYGPFCIEKHPTMRQIGDKDWILNGMNQALSDNNVPMKLNSVDEICPNDNMWLFFKEYEGFTARADGLSPPFNATDRPKLAHGRKDFNNVPYQCRVRRYDNHFEICYIFSFAYNGYFNVCGSHQGEHEGDFERITVRTDAKGERVKWVYCGSHGTCDGVWVHAKDIELRSHQQTNNPQLKQLPYDDSQPPTHPVVYCARVAHGIYPRPGTYFRLCCCANDKMSPLRSDGKNEWNPEVDPVLVFHPWDVRSTINNHWAGYPGQWGPRGVTTPSEQSWFTAETKFTNNSFRRCFWFCRYTSDSCYNNCQNPVSFY